VGSIKDRQLQIEGFGQMVGTEPREYAQASVHTKTPEDNTACVNLQLLEAILAPDNMNEAYRRVKANKGAGGIDKMGVCELGGYLKDHKVELLTKLEGGKYKPNPVRRVEIPKEEKGKVRLLGIPTVADRVIQQSIAQVLTPLYEPQFSECSYGFRPGRSAHDALHQCKQNIDEGYVWVVDMDLEKFFDTVNHSHLAQILANTIKDGRVISLIHKYLNAGVMVAHSFKDTPVGVPQGGPLSPLLSNIMLNELDVELMERGHRFVRYADDCMIFCKSRKAAERTLHSITAFIEGKLHLKVNRDKTVVAHFNEVKYLGYAFYRHKGECRFRVHPKSIKKMKARVKEITGRSKAIPNAMRPKILARFIKGWLNYFKLADMKSLLVDIDQWMRRRIRMIYWKQWKKIRTRVKMLEQYGASKGKAWEYANTRKGYWRTAVSWILATTLTNDVLKELGYINFSDYYQQVSVNQRTAVYGTVRTVV
jgi:group II intron reverse transcriptase/maturase